MQLVYGIFFNDFDYATDYYKESLFDALELVAELISDGVETIRIKYPCSWTDGGYVAVSGEKIKEIVIDAGDFVE